MRHYLTDRIEDYWLKTQLEDGVLTEDETLEKLRSFGLDKYEVSLIKSRYLEDKTMVEIVLEQGWLSVNSASYHLRKALKKLREGKFTFK